MNHRLVLVAVVMAYSVGCGVVDRSLLFFTHTTIGIEVSPADPTNPAGFVLGYKRAEGVINPVYDPEGIKKNGDAKYRAEAYSVLAALRGGATAKTPATDNDEDVGARISGGQWFATGKAAKILARQPGIAGAISGSPDIGAPAKLSSPFQKDNAGDLIEVFWKPDGEFNEENEEIINAFLKKNSAEGELIQYFIRSKDYAELRKKFVDEFGLDD